MKKFFSLIMSGIFAFSFSAIPKALAYDYDPATADIYKALKDYFKCYDDNSKNTKGITFPREDDKFILENGKTVHKDSIINPKMSDYRMIKFFNIPKMLELPSTNSNVGSVPLNLLVDLYIESRELSSEIFKDVRNKSSKETLKKLEELTTKIHAKYQNDSAFKHKIEILGSSMGVMPEEAFKSFTTAFIAHDLGIALGQQANNELKAIILDRLKAAGIIIGGIIAGQASLAVYTIIGTVVLPGIGTVIGAIVGGILNIIISAGASAYAVEKISDSKYTEIVDKRNKIIDECIDMVDLKLKEERSQNHMMVLKRMFFFMSKKPEFVVESNIFEMAVDRRNFFDVKDLKRKKDYNTALKCLDLKNYGAWCEFQFIEGSGPTTNQYVTKDGRKIDYLIQLFQAASNPEATIIDLKKLKNYASGKEIGKKIPASFHPDAEKVKRMLNKGTSLEDISYFLNMSIETIKEIQNSKVC